MQKTHKSSKPKTQKTTMSLEVLENAKNAQELKTEDADERDWVRVLQSSSEC